MSAQRKTAKIVLSLLLGSILAFSLKAEEVSNIDSDMDLETILLPPRDPFVSPLDIEGLANESSKTGPSIQNKGEFMKQVETEILRKLQTEKEKIEKERAKLKTDLEDARKTIKQEREKFQQERESLTQAIAEKSKEERRLEEAKVIAQELEKQKKRIKELLASVNLKGIIWHKDTPLAIIDDKIYSVGARYKEFQIEEITPEGITLKFKDESIPLRLR